MDEKEIADVAFAKAAHKLARHKVWFDQVVDKILAFTSIPPEQKWADVTAGNDGVWTELCDLLCKSPGDGEALASAGELTAALNCHSNLHQEYGAFRTMFAVIVARHGPQRIDQDDIDICTGKALEQKASGSGVTFSVVDAPKAH